MKIISSIKELRNELRNKLKIIFIPTMGNLHDGHLSLFRLAHKYGDFLVVSIFVNRLQFDQDEDFDKYPRTFQVDIQKLEKENIDILFAPSEKDLYPEPQTYFVHPASDLSKILEGEIRPGFFIGVTTVLLKLFLCTQPDIVIFSKKDYQQLIIVLNMVRQLVLPIKIIAAETLRAQDGLALSSRNIYLSSLERNKANYLYKTLHQIVNEIHAGNKNIFDLQKQAIIELKKHGWKPDYVEIRERINLQIPNTTNLINAKKLVILAAAKLGNTRLIDSLEV